MSLEVSSLGKVLEETQGESIERVCSGSSVGCGLPLVVKGIECSSLFICNVADLIFKLLLS